MIISRTISTWELIYRLAWLMLFVLALLGCVYIALPLWYRNTERQEAASFYRGISERYERELNTIINAFSKAASDAIRPEIEASKERLMREINALYTERHSLHQAVTTDRQLLAEVLKAQAGIAQEHRFRELVISFLIGVGSSLAATAIVAARRQMRILKTVLITTSPPS